MLLLRRRRRLLQLLQQLLQKAMKAPDRMAEPETDVVHVRLCVLQLTGFVVGAVRNVAVDGLMIVDEADLDRVLDLPSEDGLANGTDDEVHLAEVDVGHGSEIRTVQVEGTVIEEVQVGKMMRREEG